MTTTHVHENSKIIDLWFFAGISKSEMLSIEESRSTDSPDDGYEPDILLQYPSQSTLLSKAHLKVSVKLIFNRLACI